MSPIYPARTKTSTQELAKAAAARAEDSTFELLYHPVNGRAELIRNLLAFGSDRWVEMPFDWSALKPLMPFQVAPVLFETTSVPTEADPTVSVVLEIAESLAIERYLAQKFKLFGANIWEEHLVNRYYQSIEDLFQFFTRFVVSTEPGEARREATTHFGSYILRKFIRIHEGHLKENGDTGHYVGSDYTLVDLKLAQVMDRIMLAVPQGLESPFSTELTPTLWKVKERVDAKPSLAKWKQSERYLELTANTKTRYQV